MQLKSLPSLKERRRKLRSSQTEAENLLWAQVRGKKINGLRFLRQYSMGSYILDFYCPKIQLAIELDGAQHSENDRKLYDQDRDAHLRQLKIKVVRFWNKEVQEDMSGVLSRIRAICSPP